MREIVFDVEASGLRLDSRVWCLSYMEGNDPVVSLSGRKDIDEVFREWLVDDGVELIGHNIIGYDIPLLMYNKPFPPVKAFISDTKLLSKVMYPRYKAHGLKAWISRLQKLGKCPYKIEVEDFQWVEGDLDLMMDRCETDVKIQRILYDYFKSKTTRGFKDWYGIEQRWIAYICEMLANGIPFNYGKALELDGIYKEKLAVIKREGGHVAENLGSIKQCAEYVFKKYKPDGAKFELNLKKKMGSLESPSGDDLERVKQKVLEETLLPHTKKGNPSMDKFKRLKLVSQYPELEFHYRYKDTRNLHNYVKWGGVNGNNFYQYAEFHPSLEQFCVYGGFNYYGTRTLRASYKEPCFNQIPKGELRDCIAVLNPDYKILGMDVQQLELAWLGYLLKKFGDDSVWREKEDGLCPKTLTLEAFEGLFERVPEDERKDRAKTINYGLVYGLRAKGVVKYLKLDEDAKTLSRVKNSVRRRFPALESYAKYLRGKINGYGVMYNAFLQPVYAMKGEEDYDTAVNTMMQSSGSLYAKLLFSDILDEIKALDPLSRLLIFNHDESEVLVHKDFSQEMLDSCLDRAYKVFEDRNYRGIPLITKVDPHFGKTWRDVH